MKRLLFVSYLMFIIVMNIYAQDFDGIDEGRLEWISDKCNKEIEIYGYFQFSYKFRDFTERHLNIEFVEKDVLCVSNIAYRNSSPCSELSFTDLYAVHFENNHSIIVDSLLSTNRVDCQEAMLVMPFDNSESITCCNSVFPILRNGDRIMIQNNFQRLWTNSFTFDIRTYTDDEAHEFLMWFWKQ